MKKLFLIFLVFTTLFSSCKTKKQQLEVSESKAQNIFLTGKYNKLLFSDLYSDNYDVIKLETNSQSIFSFPHITKLTDDFIFILDMNKNILIQFDRQGKYINKLKNKGKGPGEYISINSFCIDRKTNTIYIQDDRQEKIIAYDIQLNFITEYKIPFYFMTFEILPTNHFAFYTALMSQNSENSFDYDIIITDKSFNILRKELPYKYTNAVRGNTEVLLSLENDIFYFYTVYSKEVYQIKDTEIIPIYQISNFLEYHLPDDKFYLERDNLPGSVVAKEIWNTDYVYSYKFYENNNKIILYYHVGGWHVSVFDKNSNQQWHTDKLIDDFGFSLDTKYQVPKFFYKDKIGYFVNSHDIEDAKKKNSSKLVNQAISDLNIEDNPAIVLFKLKK